MAVIIFAFSTVSVHAQDLVYTPVNPSFGGSPLNSGHLLAIASAQRTATARDAETDDLGTDGLDPVSTTSQADLFLQQLQGRLFSSLAGQVQEAIFGENPSEAGEITFGETTVAFERTTTEIILTIADALDGSTTVITVPQLITE